MIKRLKCPLSAIRFLLSNEIRIIVRVAGGIEDGQTQNVDSSASCLPVINVLAPVGSLGWLSCAHDNEDRSGKDGVYETGGRPWITRISTTAIAIMRSTWINPPRVYPPTNPSAQRMRRITNMVQSIVASRYVH